MSSSPWPYRSYADRTWLGGESGADRALAAVIRSVRTTTTESGRMASNSPDSLLAALENLAEIAERVDWAVLSLVGEARAHGVAWSAIGNSLGVTKQAAQQRFGPYIKQALDQAHGSATP
jgi:hypothetical protein